MSVDRGTLLLAAQRALVGSVSGNLLGACIAQDGALVKMTFYVAPSMTEDERDDLSSAASIVIGDFPDDYRIEEAIIEASPHEPLLTVGIWVHLQRDCRTVERW